MAMRGAAEAVQGVFVETGEICPEERRDSAVFGLGNLN
jgi:hypothetical protein